MSSRQPLDILIRPVITEKSSGLQFEQNKYTFQVVPHATKVDVRNAVEKMFDVEVKAVRTMNCLGKDRRVGSHVGRRPHWKKAIVTLAEGQSIDVFEGV